MPHSEKNQSRYESGNVNRQAQYLISQGELNEAKSLLLSTHHENHQDAGILLGLGVIHARDRDFINAEKWLSLAVEKAPSQPSIHIHLANTLSQLNKHEQAITHYQAA